MVVCILSFGLVRCIRVKCTDTTNMSETKLPKPHVFLWWLVYLLLVVFVVTVYFTRIQRTVLKMARLAITAPMELFYDF